MTGRNVVLRREESHRREPLLSGPPEPAANRTFREVAGGTTAECAAVCCCFPVGIVNLLLVVVYKLPKGILRRAVQSRRRRRTVLPGPTRGQCSCVEAGLKIDNVGSGLEFPDMGSEKWEVAEEMWASFDGMGFWRSPSRTELRSPLSPEHVVPNCIEYDTLDRL